MMFDAPLKMHRQAADATRSSSSPSSSSSTSSPSSPSSPPPFSPRKKLRSSHTPASTSLVDEYDTSKRRCFSSSTSVITSRLPTRIASAMREEEKETEERDAEEEEAQESPLVNADPIVLDATPPPSPDLGPSILGVGATTCDPSNVAGAGDGGGIVHLAAVRRISEDTTREEMDCAADDHADACNDKNDDGGNHGDNEADAALPPCFFGLASSTSSLRGLALSEVSSYWSGADLYGVSAGIEYGGGGGCNSCSGAEAFGEEGNGAGGGEEISLVSPSSQVLREIWTGDIGLALFSPLDTAAFEPLGSGDDHHNGADADEAPAVEEDDDEDEEEDLPLIIIPEPPSALQSSPRILTLHMMHQIRDRGLHPTAQLMSWHRAYCLSRDGDSFHTMLRLCETYSHTIFALRTTGGDVLGGYVDRPWSRKGAQAGTGRGISGGASKVFYGSGRAFLFATNAAVSDHGDEEEISLEGNGEKRMLDMNGASFHRRRSDSDDAREEEEETTRVCKARKPTIPLEETISLYRWTGNNSYSQIFDAEGGRMAMGGGGSFGIILEDNFSRGSTGRCATFGNPPLTRDCGGCFDICEFEVYGLMSSLMGSFLTVF